MSRKISYDLGLEHGKTILDKTIKKLKKKIILPLS